MYIDIFMYRYLYTYMYAYMYIFLVVVVVVCGCGGHTYSSIYSILLKLIVYEALSY
jgi:hypothetical protein